MAFSVTGFGGEQLQPKPQAFQALSVGGNLPVPPSPPYGTPNQNLVPVDRSGRPAVPANLTLAAQPIFNAILRVNPTITGHSSPGVPGVSYSTSSFSARNPSVSQINLSGSTSSAAAAPHSEAPQRSTRTTGTVTFSTTSASNAPVTVYAGTTVETSSGTRYTVLSNAVIQPNSTRVNATVQAEVPGTSGNVGAGTVTAFAPNTNPPPNVSVTNVSSFTNGQEQQTNQNTTTTTAVQVQNSTTNSGVGVPQGDVSFALTKVPSYVTSDAEAFQQTVANLKVPQAAPPQEAPQPQQPQQSAQTQAPQHDQQPAPPQQSPATQPSSSATQYAPPANESLVSRIAATVTQLAISAVYPAPVFSFSV